MRRLLQFLVKLYPKVWRERYGAEFGALLEDMEPRLNHVGNVLAHALTESITAVKIWQWMAVGALATMGVPLIFLWRAPHVYSSTATLRVTSIAPGTDTRREMDRLVTFAFADDQLFSVIRRNYLYEDELAVASKGVGYSQQLGSMLRPNIEFASRHSQALRIGDKLPLKVTYRDGAQARMAARELMGLLIDATAKLSIPVQFEVYEMPGLPAASNLWVNGRATLGGGFVAGAAFALLAAALHLGWRERAGRA